MKQADLSSRAIALHRKGDLPGANQLYLQILQGEPGNFPARHMLGLVRFQQGRNSEALNHIVAALEINSGVAEAWSNYGLVLFALERLDDALGAFDRAVALKADYPEAFNHRGAVLDRLGRYVEALLDFEQALNLKPVFPEAMNNRGNVLRVLGRIEDARSSYDKALEINPGFSEARTNCALLPEASGQPAGHKPDALINRGAALRSEHRLAEALTCFNRVLNLQPDNVVALTNRGAVLLDMKQPDEALESFERALAADPGYASAMYARGYALGEMRRLEEAIEAYEQAGAMDPGHKAVFESIAHAALHLCDWKRTAQIGAQLKAHVFEKKANIYPFVLLGYSSDPALLLEGAQTFIRKRIPVLPAPLWEGRPYGHEKIRLAYLSADYRSHATSNLVAELMERHDRTRFEVLGISFGVDDGSSMRARMQKSFDRFLDVRGISDLDVARLMRGLEVDIAVDLKGYTADQRPEIFSHRPAPVQVNYLGFPGSMGATFIDYVIGDPVVTPFAHAPFFSEKIVQLPDCYQANDSTRPIAPVTPSRAEAGLPERGFVFCCFNDSYKLTPTFFDIWARLLKEVDGSVLWLIMTQPATAEYLHREIEARGIDRRRLVFAPKMELAEHLARHRLADLFLDTLPYNAHTTTSDALWAGLPVITCTGTSFAGRVATSLLHAVGLPELATKTLEEYEMLALTLARDPKRLSSLRTRLAAQRHTTPLFDGERFRRHIESAYIHMRDLVERGEIPRSFKVGTPFEQ